MAINKVAKPAVTKELTPEQRAKKYAADRDKMQRACAFHDPQKAWDAIEKHTHPEAV